MKPHDFERTSMSVLAVSSQATRSQDFTTLQSTLQAGNLTAAQSAFAAFLQDVQNVALTAGAKSLFAAGTQTSKDLQTLGNALKSADLPGAQRAFATLEQDLRATTPSGNVQSGNHGAPSHYPLRHG